MVSVLMNLKGVECKCRRNIEVDDMKDMDELKTYIKMFIEAVEKGLKEELK
jgi:hypothetical protein